MTAAEPTSDTSITGIDHAVIAARDLEAARDVWQRLGFTMAPRGRHVGWGTANYTMLFQHDYLELRGIVDPSQFVGTLDKFLEHGEGLSSLVLASDNASDFYEWLRGEADTADAPRDLERLIEYEGTEETLRFRFVPVPGPISPGLLATAVEHLTPDELRRPELLSHPNGARSILEITVAMEDLTGVAEAYAKLFGNAAVNDETRRGRVTIAAGTAELLFLTPKEFPKRHYDVGVGDDLPLPRMAALTLEVADPAATALYLSGQTIPYEREPDGTVLVEGTSASGVLLEFARRPD